MNDDRQTTALTCCRRIQFCAGHRVMGHESKCANLHGHNYVAHVHAAATAGLDPLGRVIDFSVLKQLVGGWIERWWDHGFLLSCDDAAGAEAILAFTRFEPKGQKVYYLPYNPTAENIARFLLDLCNVGFPEAADPRFQRPLLEGSGVRVTRVVIEETENCSAEAAAVAVCP